jgi:DNA-binding GntR family transcriptional regulator
VSTDFIDSQSSSPPSLTGSDRVLEAIKRAILRGELLPGEQLRQERLAGDLGVSRVPLREALLVLANQGLLVHHPHQGFILAKRSKDELSQLHYLLSLLEEELVRTVEWPDDVTIARLRELNEQMAAMVDSSEWIDIVQLNHEFHKVVWCLSRMNMVADEVQRVWPLADAYAARGYASRQNRAESVDYHDRIIDALERRDLKELQRVSAEHRGKTAVDTEDPIFF